MPGFVFNFAMQGFGTRQEDWSAFSYVLTLVNSGYIPRASHRFMSAISLYELSSVSFTAGFNGSIRKDVPAKTVFLNETSNQVEYRASLVSYAGFSAGTVDAYIIGREAGTNASSFLIAYFSGGNLPFPTNGGDFNISFTNSGVFVMRRAG